MKTGIKYLLALCMCWAMLSLMGCASLLGLRPAELSDEMIAQKGIVFGSVNPVDGLMSYSSYYFHLKSVETGEVVRLRVLLSDFMPEKADENDNGVLRYIAATDVAPGEYEFFRLSAFATNGYVSETVTFTLKQPEQFQVEAGKTYYLGAAVPLPKIGENFLGVDEIKGLKFILMDNEQADTTLAKRIFPNLPAVTALEIFKGLSYSSDSIQKAALSLNPEAKFWGEGDYERVINIPEANEAMSVDQTKEADPGIN